MVRHKPSARADVPSDCSRLGGENPEQLLPARVLQKRFNGRRPVMADEKTKTGGQQQASITTDLDDEAIHLA